MRTIEPSTAFKKDFKRVRANSLHTQDALTRLEAILNLLREDKPLPESFRDHSLLGNWKNHLECHVKPNLLLIYRTEEPNKLHLARLGSHSELFKS